MPGRNGLVLNLVVGRRACRTVRRTGGFAAPVGRLSYPRHLASNFIFPLVELHVLRARSVPYAELCSLLGKHATTGRCVEITGNSCNADYEIGD